MPIVSLHALTAWFLKFQSCLRYTFTPATWRVEDLKVFLYLFIYLLFIYLFLDYYTVYFIFLVSMIIWYMSITKTCRRWKIYLLLRLVYTADFGVRFGLYWLSKYIKNRECKNAMQKRAENRQCKRPFTLLLMKHPSIFNSNYRAFKLWRKGR